MTVSARPAFHVTAERNWLSDPNAPILWNGRFHLFHQYNPDAPEWGLMRWGHLSSDDLVHWVRHPVALEPRAGEPDADGCWSGCLHIVDGRPVVFYTGASGAGDAHRQVVLRAQADDALEVYRHVPGEPVVPAAGPRLGTLQQRDPFVLRFGDRWLMLLGTGIATADGLGQGAVVAWESGDTIGWTYRGVVLTLPRDVGPVDTGPVWECPQLVRVGDKWVLVVSVQLPGVPQPRCPYAVWFTGEFDGSAFVPEATGLLDRGDVLYAPAVAEGVPDRVLFWAWIQESPDTAPLDFAGVLSLPRELTVRSGVVVTRPAPELDAIWAAPLARFDYLMVRAGEVMTIGRGLPPEYRLVLGPVSGELAVGLGTDGTGPVELRLVGAPGARELRVEGADGMRHRIPIGDPCETTVIVDHSVVEVFTDGPATLTFRTNPVLDSSAGVTVDSPAGAVVHGLELAPRRT